MPVSISSDKLYVEMLSPEDKIVSHRFDRSCFITDVVLNGKHRFCVPEQYKKERWTSYGSGICAEFIWPQISAGTKAGEEFLKPGVGFLVQEEDGKPYHMMGNYDVNAYPLTLESGENWVRFVHDIPRRGDLGVKIYREAVVRGETLAVYTTMENTGGRDLDLVEYNHNFLAIDSLPVGPGYHLHIPFDGEFEKLSDTGFSMETRERIPGLLVMEGENTVTWSRDMDNMVYFKETEGPGILPMAKYYWRLSHDKSPAYVEEAVSFVPHRYALWGIEHCICPEVFVKINIKPGGKQCWARTWTFGG